MWNQRSPAIHDAPPAAVTVPHAHSDLNYSLPGTAGALEFWWRPFPLNISEALHNLTTITTKPDAVVTSFCSWHLGFIRDLEEWKDLLETLRLAGKVWEWVHGEPV